MKTKFNVVIIGGGVMGLMAAYALRKTGQTIAIVDAGRIGGTQAASSSITRSIRNDYQDSQLARMAYDAYNRWLGLQSEWECQLIESCGCLNIFNKNLSKSKAEESYVGQALSWLKRDGRKLDVLSDAKQLSRRYKQFSADFGIVDEAAGLALSRVVMDQLLVRLKADDQVTILENTTATAITEKLAGVTIKVKDLNLQTGKLIIAAGLGTPQVCSLIANQRVNLPIAADRPFELKYFFPRYPARYSAPAMPVFAFLDVGIYGHPIIPGQTEGVKIGYYRPPGLKSSPASTAFIDHFVETCLPNLFAQSSNTLIRDVDQCAYDMTPDNRFILGRVGSSRNIIVAAGFNGTGYKFAPVIGNVLRDLALDRAVEYNLQPFDPNRFTDPSAINNTER